MQIKMRKVLALLSVLAMLCTLLPVGALMSVTAATTNLIANGDFESGNYTGWTKNGMTPTVSADAAHSGDYGVHLYGTNAWASFNQYITLEPSTTYHISFWYKSGTDATISTGFEVKTKNDSGSYSDKTTFLTTGGQSLSASKSTTTWTQVQSVFTTKDSGDMSHLFTFYRGNGTSDAANPASVYLDDIVLTKLEGGSSNMLLNGGFESTLDPWTQYTSSSQNMSISTDAYAGANSVVIPFVARSLTVSQVVDVEPNTDYVVTFYYKSLDSASKNILFGAYDLTAANNGSGVGDLASAAATLKIANTEWTQGAYVFNSGENTQVRMAFSGSSSTNPTNRKAMLVDEVVMSKIGGEEPSEPETPDAPDEEVDGNLVVNGYFNDGTATGWTVSGGEVEAYNGDYMLKGTTTGRYATVAKQTIAVDANSDYTLDVHALYVGGATQATARVHVYAADGSTDLVSGYYWTISPNVLNEKQFSFNTGDNTSVVIGVQQMPAASSSDAFDGNIYYDNFEMLKVSGDEPEEPEGNETPSNDGYVINGDFETGDLTGWTVEHGGAINWTEVASGNFALEGTATAKYSPFISQTVTVEANTDYTITFKAKLAAAGGQVRFYVSPDGTTNANIASPYYFTSTTEWATYQLTFNSGDNTSLVLFPAQGVNGGGNIYYDDIVMEKVETGYTGLYPETMTSGADIRFMTYNVLVGQDTANGGYSWGSAITGRPEKACAMINYYKPDVIALEEFSGEWYDYFVANMPDYAFGEMTSADSQNNGKLYTCIAYNVNTIRLLDTDLFRNTVSRWGTQGMRYVNVGFCEVIATGEKFIAAVTHPDAGNLVGTEDLNGDGVAEEGDGYWRPQQLEEAAAYVAELSETNKMPVIWGGDFNSGLDGTYDDNVSWYKVADAGFTDATAGRYIDHIFYNSMATHLYETTVADAAVNGASDHKAVFADIQFLDEYATPIKDAKDYIKTQGRNQLKDGALWLDFSASGIEFSANCEGTVALNLTVNSIKNTDATYGGLYFTVIVDGVQKDRAECRITETGSVQLVLAEDLPAGNHTFEVYRQTEHRGAEVGINSIVMNGSFNEKPEDNRLYIEFIGDSISTGYGALGDNNVASANADNPLYQDATVAYPYLTAKALNADFSDVCYSGLGCKYGYSSVTMQTVYTAQRYQYDQNTQYDFTKRQPDVVVIALGTNDIANQTDASLRKVGYQEMLDLVRAKNPDAKIVWIAGMMKTDDNAMIEALIEENGGAAEGLYYLGLTTNTAGAGWHPSAAGQQKFADDLVAFLNSDVLVKYVGDEMLDNDEGDVIDYIGSSRMEMTSDKLGLAFGYGLNIEGLEIVNGCYADLTNATVDAFGDGTQYKLLAMGTIVSNDAVVGLSDMKLDDVDGKKTIDVNAERLYDLEGTYAQFAVRITNIPLANEATVIYARAYFVIEYEGREVVVYDDTQSANYINKYDSNDGVLEW